MKKKCPIGIILLAAAQILASCTKMLFFIPSLRGAAPVTSSTTSATVIAVVIFQIVLSFGLIRGWRWTHVFMVFMSAVLAILGVLSILLSSSTTIAIVGVCVKIIILVYLLASSRVRRHFYDKNKTNPNQQVEPIVTTPVDKVEAQSTQAHP